MFLFDHKIQKKVMSYYNIHLQEIIGFINETCFKISSTSDGNAAALEKGIKQEILSKRRIRMKLCDDNCKEIGKHCSW